MKKFFKHSSIIFLFLAFIFKSGSIEVVSSQPSQEVSITATVTGEDAFPPITSFSATANGSPYINETWTRYAISILLTCSDVSGGGSVSGCDTTYYCTDSDNTCTPTSLYTEGINIDSEGTTYIRYYSKDMEGNEESTKYNSLQIDITPPTVLVTNLEGDSSSPYTDTSNNNKTDLILNVSDSLSSVYNCRYSENNVVYNAMTNNCSAPAGGNVTCSISSLPVGNYMYYYTCSDTAGNASTPTSLSFSISYTPTGGTITPPSSTENLNTNEPVNTNTNETVIENTNVNVNASLPPVAVSFTTNPIGLTNTTPITLVTSAQQATTMCFWGDINTGYSEESPLCVPYQNAYSAYLTSNDGTKNISVYFKSTDGILSDALTTSVVLDRTPPIQPSFSIPSQTVSPTIALTVNTVGDATWLRITSQDIINTNETFEWTGIKNTYTLTLFGDYGVKTISLQTKDEAGNMSNITTKTIEYKQPLVVPENTNENEQPVNVNFNLNLNTNNTPSGQQQNINENSPDESVSGGDIDSDQDGINNEEELLYRTDPNKRDTDNDGISDYDEIFRYHTDPLNADTDNDFLSDGKEINIHHTDPLNPDTDGDTVMDGTEVAQGTDPLDPKSKQTTEIIPIETTMHPVAKAPAEKQQTNVNTTATTPASDNTWNKIDTIGERDTDHDGLSDLLEMRIGTDPKKWDTDGDSFSDGEEYLEYGTNPLDSEDNAKTNAKLKISNWKSQDIMIGEDWFIKGACKYPTSIQVYLVSETKEEILLGQTVCEPENKFILTFSKPVADGYYSIIAKSYDENDAVVEENIVPSIMVDKAKKIAPPIPQALDTSTIAFDDNGTVRSTVTDNKMPTIYGRTSFGLEVHATFESIITSSSIITDSANGEFSITSSKPLENGVHKVTLYTVAPNGIRSTPVIIPFIITDAIPSASSVNPRIWWPLVLLVISMSLTVFFYGKDKKRRKTSHKMMH